MGSGASCSCIDLLDATTTGSHTSFNNQQKVAPTSTILSTAKARDKYQSDGSLSYDCTEDQLKFRVLLDDPTAFDYLASFASAAMMLELDHWKHLMVKSRVLRSNAESAFLAMLVRISETASAGKLQTTESITLEHNENVAHSFNLLYNELFCPFKESSVFGKMLHDMETVYEILPNDFEYFSRLGSGGFGIVVSCRRVLTGALYAMKVQPKALMLHNMRKAPGQVMIEMLGSTIIKHPYICEAKIAFQTSKLVFLAMPIFPAGDLSRALKLQPEGCFSKVRTQFYAAVLASVLMYLHENGLIYRDLKPENVLMRADGHIVLCDLGSISDDSDALVPMPKQQSYSQTKSLNGLNSNKSTTISTFNDAVGSFLNVPSGSFRVGSHPPPATAAASGISPSLTRANSILRSVGCEVHHQNQSGRYLPDESFTLSGQRSAHASYAQEMKARGVVGTLKYMSPESLALFADEVGLTKVPGCTASIDWFSYGILVHEMLTGHVPFRPPVGMTYSKLHQIYPDMLRMVNYDIAQMHTILLGKFEPNEVATARLGQDGLEFVTGLVQLDPHVRFGINKSNSSTDYLDSYSSLKSQKFFEGIDWVKLEKREIDPPYSPTGVDFLPFAMNTPHTFEAMLESLKRSHWNDSVVEDKDQVYFSDWFHMDPEVVGRIADGSMISLSHQASLD